MHNNNNNNKNFGCNPNLLDTIGIVKIPIR